MTVDPTIFRAYDIRGIYGKELFDETAEHIAKGYATIIKPTTVVVGRDARLSGPALHARLVEALTDVGINVIDIGMVCTDMYYYACAIKGLPGIMVTASHNPKEYNGFKMVKKIPYLLSGDAGIQDIRIAIENNDFPASATIKGTVTQWDVTEGFIEKMLSLGDVTKFKKMKIIADTANGMVGPTLEKLFAHIPQIELVPMYFEPDGNLPNHGGDPLLAENRKEIEARVPAENADLGVMFDPDGDRFFAIDRKGRFVPGDFMTAIMSYYFLERFPKATIVYDIRASKAVPDTIIKYGGTPLFNKVGHSFIKKRMEDTQAVFAGEVSGHYYFRDFYGCDSGIGSLMYLLDVLAHGELSIDQVYDQYASRYFLSGEINSKVQSVKDVLIKLEEKYGPQAQEVIKIDGITCEFDGWRFNVRGSNNEPLIRLNLEATNQQLMEEKRDELLSVIRQ